MIIFESLTNEGGFMSNFKRFSLLFLTLVLLLTLSSCYQSRGFSGGGYNHMNYRYNSYNDSHDRDYRGDHHNNYNKNYYRK